MPDPDRCPNRATPIIRDLLDRNEVSLLELVDAVFDQLDSLTARGCPPCEELGRIHARLGTGDDEEDSGA